MTADSLKTIDKCLHFHVIFASRSFPVPAQIIKFLKTKIIYLLHAREHPQQTARAIISFRIRNQRNFSYKKESKSSSKNKAVVLDVKK